MITTGEILATLFGLFLGIALAHGIAEKTARREMDQKTKAEVARRLGSHLEEKLRSLRHHVANYCGDCYLCDDPAELISKEENREPSDVQIYGAGVR